MDPRLTINDYLGSGECGSVFRVHYNSQEAALKAYKVGEKNDHQGPELRNHQALGHIDGIPAVIAVLPNMRGTPEDLGFTKYTHFYNDLEGLAQEYSGGHVVELVEGDWEHRLESLDTNLRRLTVDAVKDLRRLILEVIDAGYTRLLDTTVIFKGDTAHLVDLEFVEPFTSTAEQEKEREDWDYCFNEMIEELKER